LLISKLIADVVPVVVNDGREGKELFIAVGADEGIVAFIT